MITLSLNFDTAKKVRELVGTHFSFPGSDKLTMDLTVKENGASSVTFAGPKEIISEAKRLWVEKGKPTAEKVQSKVNSVASKAKKNVKKAAKSAATKRKVVTVKVKAKTPANKKKK